MTNKELELALESDAPGVVAEEGESRGELVRGAAGVACGEAAMSALHLVKPDSDAFRELMRRGHDPELAVYACVENQVTVCYMSSESCSH